MFATTQRPLRSRPAWPFSGDKLALVDLLESWRSRKDYREELRRLLAVGAYMVDDIGLTEEEARAEATKPFWQV